MSDGGKVTLADKILVHLLPFARDGARDEARLTQTQAGIAEALRARRSHVTQALQGLLARGEVEARTARIPGGSRRRKAYWLTAKGYARAATVRDRLAAMPVLVDGDGSRVPLGQIARRLGGLRDALGYLRADGVLDFSARPRTASKTVVALEVRCPHCEAAFTAIGPPAAPAPVPLR